MERTLNELLEAEAGRLCGAGCYKHTEARKDIRAGHFTRKLDSNAGQGKLKVPKLKSSAKLKRHTIVFFTIDGMAPMICEAHAFIDKKGIMQ